LYLQQLQELSQKKIIILKQEDKEMTRVEAGLV
jgi:hypothetical protein